MDGLYGLGALKIDAPKPIHLEIEETSWDRKVHVEKGARTLDVSSIKRDFSPCWNQVGAHASNPTQSLLMMETSVIEAAGVQDAGWCFTFLFFRSIWEGSDGFGVTMCVKSVDVSLCRNGI